MPRSRHLSRGPNQAPVPRARRARRRKTAARDPRPAGASHPCSTSKPLAPPPQQQPPPPPRMTWRAAVRRCGPCCREGAGRGADMGSLRLIRRLGEWEWPAPSLHGESCSILGMPTWPMGMAREGWDYAVDKPTRTCAVGPCSVWLGGACSMTMTRRDSLHRIGGGRPGPGRGLDPRTVQA